MILSTGGSAPGGFAPGGCLVPGGSVGGVPGPWGGLLLGGAWLGGCYLMETPGTDTAAGGTHPTGMHSHCYEPSPRLDRHIWAGWGGEGKHASPPPPNRICYCQA